MGNYLDYKHGGNKKLIALYEQKVSENFEKYFIYTLQVAFKILTAAHDFCFLFHPPGAVAKSASYSPSGS